MSVRKKWGKGSKAAIPMFAILAAGMMMKMPVQAAEITEDMLSDMVIEESEEVPEPETEVTSGTCGTNVTWSYDSDAKKLTISGSGTMATYTSDSNAPWYDVRENIESVVVGDGVTSIGDYAFYECSSLSSIELPTELTSTGVGAFAGCSSLSSIELPSGLTSIGMNAFTCCSSLSSIELPSGLTSIGMNAFENCSSLSSIELPSGLTSIGVSVFARCSSLSSIELPDGVTNIGAHAFYRCSSLSSIELPSGLKSIGASTFYSCSSLSSIELPSGVTSIGSEAFRECSSLSSIGLPSGVTSIGSYAFCGCSSLSSIGLPSGLKSIGGYAFCDCSSLSSIEIPSGVISVGSSAFSGCSKLKTAVTACSWKETPLYTFSAGVSRGYNHTGNITVQTDDAQDIISIYCNDCSANPDRVSLTVPANRTYTGNPIEAIASSTNVLYVPSITYTGSNLVNGSPQNAGTYTASMKVNTPQGEKTVSLEYEIEKAASSCTIVPSAKSLTYTGSAQTLVNEGIPDGGTMYYSLSENGNFDATIPQKTDAGDYTVYYKVVGDGNHTDTGINSVDVTIEKADGIISGEDSYTKIYDGEAFETITANHSESELQYEITAGDDVISISGNQLNILKAGEATVKVTLPESANYTGAEKTITITVQKKAGYTPEEINKSYLYLRENADSIDLTALLPADCGTVSYSVPQTEGTVTYTGAPAIENGILSYTVNAGEAGAQGTIKTTVSSDNYEDFDIIVNVKLHNQIPIRVKEGTEVTLKKNTLIFGEALSVLEFHPAVFEDENGNEVAGTLAWKEPQTVPALETQSAIWVFTPDEPEYATLEGSVVIVVNQVTDAPDMPDSAMKVPFAIRKVSEVTLPENWVWKTEDADKALKPEEPLTATAVYTGADIAKYKNVSVEVTITRDGKEWVFTDVSVKAGHWKYENIRYVYNNEIMNGINGTTLFKPDENLNRAMFATVLYRMAGSPQVSYEAVFPDVEEGRYYSEAIVWAKQQGMVTGYGDGTYGVNRNITREQIAKILYEYAAGCGYDVSGVASLTSFTDADEVSDWAEGYIRWAVHTGMIEGKPNDDGSYRIDPKGDATRAECAKMLRYFMKSYQ